MIIQDQLYSRQISYSIFFPVEVKNYGRPGYMKAGTDSKILKRSGSRWDRLMYFTPVSFRNLLS